MEEHAVYRVLMVEDDRGIAQAVQTQGELWNLQVRQVQDLRHVMEEFAAFDPHLVLLDIGLPCFDGYHWCTEIRRVSRVPVIFISSAAALNDRGSLEADGPVFAAADTIGCGEGNFVLVTRGSNARYACKCAEAPVDMAVVGILDGGQWGLS